MKKLFALLLVFSLVAALAACAKKPAGTDTATGTTAAGAQETEAEAPADEETETVVDADEAFSPEALTPGEYPAVTYGRITGIAAPEGWSISPDSADWRIVYVQGENDDPGTPTIQLTTDEDSAEKLVQSLTARMDENGEVYTSEKVEVNGIEFTTIVPEAGVPAMYANVEGGTLVVTFTRTVDTTSEAFADIVSNVTITPAE